MDNRLDSVFYSWNSTFSFSTFSVAAGFSLHGHSPTGAGTGFIHTCPQPFEQHIMPRAAQLLHSSTQMPKPLTGGHLPGRGRTSGDTAMGGDVETTLVGCLESQKRRKRGPRLITKVCICMFAWLRGCVVAWLRGCVVAWLRGCVVAWLRGCVVAWLRGCVVARLRGCVVAWLRGCVVAWLRGCMVAWFTSHQDCRYYTVKVTTEIS